MSENQPPPGDPLAGIYTLIAGIGAQMGGVNERLGQALQLSAMTQDSVEKIKTVQAKDVVDTTVFQTNMANHIKEVETLKTDVKSQGGRISAIEDWIKAWKVRIGMVVAFFTFIGFIVQFVLNYGGKLKEMMGW